MAYWKRSFVPLVILCVFLAWSAPCFAQPYTEKYIYNEIRTPITQLFIKGYSSNVFEGSFYSNGWTESWWGSPGNITANHSTAPGFQVPLDPGQSAYLDTIHGLAAGRWQYVNLSNQAAPVITADPGPAGIPDPAILNRAPDPFTIVGETSEMLNYVVDPLDPFNIIIEHYITTYVEDVTPQLIGAVYRGPEENGGSPEPVPEPATLFLLVSGLAGLGLSGIRRLLSMGND